MVVFDPGETRSSLNRRHPEVTTLKIFHIPTGMFTQILVKHEYTCCDPSNKVEKSQDIDEIQAIYYISILAHIGHTY